MLEVVHAKYPPRLRRTFPNWGFVCCRGVICICCWRVGCSFPRVCIICSSMLVEHVWFPERTCVFLRSACSAVPKNNDCRHVAELAFHKEASNAQKIWSLINPESWPYWRQFIFRKGEMSIVLWTLNQNICAQLMAFIVFSIIKKVEPRTPLDPNLIFHVRQDPIGSVCRTLSSVGKISKAISGM